MLDSFQEFLDGPAGDEYVKKHTKFITLAVGDMCFVPFGYLICPLLATLEKIPEWSSMWTISLFEVEWAKALSSACRQAIANFNRSHLSENRQRRMWASRSKAFELFCISIGVEPPQEEDRDGA